MICRNSKGLFAIAMLFAPFSANASNTENWDSFTDVAAYGLIGVALALPAYKNDWHGLSQAGFSVASATTAGELGKSNFKKDRPDASGDDSFPSNHTASAFAAATTLNIRYGTDAGFPAFGIAALIAAGRIQADKHYWEDVLVGAAIGSLAGWVFTDADAKFHVIPRTGKNNIGLAVLYSW